MPLKLTVCFKSFNGIIMGAAFKIAVTALILLCFQFTFSQQLRLGKNPYAVEKSAVLELYSDNQGLLLPRIADTSFINVLNPPDGMIIYFIPFQKLMVRANGYWQGLTINNSVVTSLNGNTGALTMDTTYISNFYLKVRSLNSVTGPLTYNSSTGGIGITQANTSTSGYLSNTDWDTFNNKVSASRTISTTAPLQGGGDLSANRTLSITQATASTNGYLSSTDWNTFNNKLSSIDTTNISNFSIKVRSLFSGTAPVTYSNGLIGITLATTSTNGYLSSTDWNTFNNKLSSVDTSNISNFYLKVRKELSAGTGISYNNNTGIITNSGVISINGNTGALTMDTTYISNFYTKVRTLLTAGTGISYNAGTGVISSTINSGNFWNTGGNTGTTPGTNFIGTTDNQDLVFKTNNTEMVRIVSSTGDIKIGSSTTGTLRATQELVLRQDGDTYGPSILRLRNRNAENGAIFETTDPSITLVDFIFKTAASQRNIRYEARSTYAKAGTPSFHIGGSSPDNPTLAVGDNYAAFNTNLKIGNYNTPSEALDVTGNIRFSGALMPNNNAGISGYILSSNGSNNAPTWIDFKLSNLNDVTLTSPSNGQLLQFNGTNWVNTSPSFQAPGNYLTDPASNGIVARTALNTTTSRTITGTANRITLTNGNGVSGNPTIDISSSYVGQSSITTLGTVTTGTWNGTTIGIASGGTGQTTANAALNALLPSQSGNSGEVLTTDGTNTSWNETEKTTLLTSDVTNNNATANTIADVTGLSFNVTSGNTYKFRFVIAYTAAATTTGSRWSVNGPASTFLYYHSNYSLTTTSTTENEGLSTYNVPAASNATSAATGSNIAIIEGIIKPSANGTVIARFASEVSGSAIVAKSGSYVEYKQLN